MRIDEYGVLHFWDGGESDAGPGEGDGGDVGSADSAADVGGVDAGAAEAASLGLDVGTPGTATGSVSANTGAGLDEASNLTQADLNALSNAGLGSLQGINPNNPTQSVDEAIAANNVHAALNVAVPALVSLVTPPGFGLISKGAQIAASLASGATTVGQAVSSLGLGIVSQALGVPPGTLNAALNGNLGQVVANTTMASAPAVIGAITGVPAGVVGLGMNVSGLGQQGNQAIAGTVNEALGITPSNAALGSVAQSIDAALGTTGGAGSTTGSVGSSPSDFGPGGEFAPPSTATPGSASQAKSDNTAALLALLAASGLEDQNKEAPYETPFLPQRSASPFGLMYGLDNSRMYG